MKMGPSKLRHVLRVPNTDRSHTCHWPGCNVAVKPAMWGCRKHWGMLPERIRREIWAAYRAGQEVDKRPSQRYIDAARAAQDWINTNIPQPGELFEESPHHGR